MFLKNIIICNQSYWMMNLNSSEIKASYRFTWCSFIWIARLTKSSKCLIGYHSGRNSIWELLTDNTGVRGVLKTPSSVCDIPSLRKCELLISRKRSIKDNWPSPQYGSKNIFVLSIYLWHPFRFRNLNLETYVYRYTRTHLGSYQTSMMELSSKF